MYDWRKLLAQWCDIRWTATGYIDPAWGDKKLSVGYAVAIHMFMFVAWVRWTPFGWMFASVLGAVIYFLVESLWNTFTEPDAKTGEAKFKGPWTPNLRRGRLSTVIQLILAIMTFQHAVHLSLAMSFGNGWLFCLAVFPVVFWAYEIAIVHACLILWGQRPWAKYHGKGAWANGAIKFGMYPLWALLLGPAVWHIVPRLVQFGDSLAR